MTRRSEVPRITDAPRSRADELRYRERRYVIMMLIRALCLVAITVLFTAHVKYPVLWVPILIFGVVFLPWFAVLMANDRTRRRDYHSVRRPHEVIQPMLTAAERPEEPPRTIDVDPDDN